MAAQDDLPAGNLRLAERSYRLLRRDYFYTDWARPTEGNPLLLNVVGYLAISVLVLTFSAAVLAEFGVLVPGIGLLVLPLLGLFFLSFVLHGVLTAAGLFWRVGCHLAGTGR